MEYAVELGKVLFLFSVVMGFASILTWMERKQSAVMQDRIGANRADIFGFRILGLFHIIADTLKMFTKEDFVPPQGNRLVHTIAPMIALFFAIVSFSAIPFGGIYEIGGYTVMGRDGSILARGNYMTLWRKVNGEWRVFRDMSTATG